jgi:hypothetical protein
MLFSRINTGCVICYSSAWNVMCHFACRPSSAVMTQRINTATTQHRLCNKQCRISRRCMKTVQNLLMTRKGPWKGNYFLYSPRSYCSGLHSDVLQRRCSILRTYFQIILRGIPLVVAVCFTLCTVSTLRCVRATSVAVEKQLVFWVWVCSLIYSACNTHAPYCHL